MHQKITIALDMMSGDHGVSSSVPAAEEALQKFNNLFLILVGDNKEIWHHEPVHADDQTGRMFPGIPPGCRPRPMA